MKTRGTKMCEDILTKAVAKRSIERHSELVSLTLPCFFMIELLVKVGVEAFNSTTLSSSPHKRAKPSCESSKPTANKTFPFTAKILPYIGQL